MAAFGGIPFGGGGGGQGSIGVPLGTGLVLPAYRIAGITQRAMIGPSDDMYAEAIPQLNRLIGSLNNSRLNIFTVRIDAFNISGGIKTFYVGSGAASGIVNGVQFGAFDMPRPQSIQNGVIGLGPAGTNGLVRMPPMYQMDDEDWAQVSLQDIPNGVPLAFYYDGSYDPTTGFALIYLWTQTTNAYSVEWYTWQAIPTFATKDDLVALPPGYEDMLAYNLAARLAALNPHMAKMDPMSYQIARDSLAAIQSKNAPDARTVSDYPGAQPRHYDYRIGYSR